MVKKIDDTEEVVASVMVWMYMKAIQRACKVMSGEDVQESSSEGEEGSEVAIAVRAVNTLLALIY